MSEVSFARFGFSIDNLDEDTFDVLKFEGTEELSRPFDFTIDLFSRNPHIHLDELIGKRATFSIATDRATRRLHGAVAEIEAGDEVIDGRYHYQVRFVPRIWLKQLSRHNQIHQAMSVVDVLRVELTGTSGKGVKDASALHLEEGRDFEFRLSGKYPPREYTVQWEETDLDFFQRLLETYGLYYYFDHSGGCDKVVICDWKVFLPAIEPTERFRFRGRRDVLASDEPTVDRIAVRHRAVARRVIVADYNDQKPQLDIQAEAAAAGNGIGVESRYGEHVLSLSEARQRAQLDADAAKARAVVYEGDSTCHMFEPGHCIELSGHFRAAFNRRYRMVFLHHEGRTETPGGSTDMRAEAGRRARYGNHFRCLADTVEFRPQRLTPRPKVEGLISARIDAEGSGGAAEIDDQGRYKVRFFFDLSGAANGHASCYLRLATPFGGPQEGLHYPLRKGAEVIVSFLNGDPDRPVITGVVPNPATPNVVTSANRMNYVTKTPGGVTHVFGNRLSDSLPQAGAQQMGHLEMARQDRVSGEAGVYTVANLDGDVAEVRPSVTVGEPLPPTHAFGDVIEQPLDQQFGDPPSGKSATANANYSATLVESDGTGNGAIIGYHRLGDSAEGAGGSFQTVETGDHYTGDKDANNYKMFQYVDGGRLNVTYGKSFTYVKGNTTYATYADDGLLRKWTSNHSSGAGNIDFTYTYARCYNVTWGSKVCVNITNCADVTAGFKTGFSLASKCDVNIATQTQLNLAAKFELSKTFSFARVFGPSIEIAKQKNLFASDSITIGIADLREQSNAKQIAAIAGAAAVTAATGIGGVVSGSLDAKLSNGDTGTGSMDAIDIALMGANISANALGAAQYLYSSKYFNKATSGAGSAPRIQLGKIEDDKNMAKLELNENCRIELSNKDGDSIALIVGDYSLNITDTGITIKNKKDSIFSIDKGNFKFQSREDVANCLSIDENSFLISHKIGTIIKKNNRAEYDSTKDALGASMLGNLSINNNLRVASD